MRKLDANELGYAIDPVYGKLTILQIGDAGKYEHAFLLKGEGFGPDWREESELISIHLTGTGRKKAAHLG